MNDGSEELLKFPVFQDERERDIGLAVERLTADWEMSRLRRREDAPAKLQASGNSKEELPDAGIFRFCEENPADALSDSSEKFFLEDELCNYTVCSSD